MYYFVNPPNGVLNPRQLSAQRHPVVLSSAAALTTCGSGPLRVAEMSPKQHICTQGWAGKASVKLQKIIESRTGWGREESLEVIWVSGGHLDFWRSFSPMSPAEAGPPGCPGSFPDDFWLSPRMEIPRLRWATCSVQSAKSSSLAGKNLVQEHQVCPGAAVAPACRGL